VRRLEGPEGAEDEWELARSAKARLHQDIGVLLAITLLVGVLVNFIFHARNLANNQQVPEAT